MNQTQHLYFPNVDQTLWTGRKDALDNEYLYQRVQYLDLNTASTASLNGYCLLGFESDEGVKRNLGNEGAKDGPMSFRQAASKLPVHAPFNLYDAGNVKCLDNDLESAQAELKGRVADILSRGLTPIVIGGGHETAWGHFQGIEHMYPHDDITILNFDAHFDLRPLIHNQLGSSGTPFRQISNYLEAKNKPFHYFCAGIQPYSNIRSLFDFAKAKKVDYLLAEHIHANPYDLNFIEKAINASQHIYVTLCLDVFGAAFAPGVSAAQTLGIAPTFVIEALRLLKQSQKVVALDIVELAPNYDRNQQTAKLAALLFMEYVAG